MAVTKMKRFRVLTLRDDSDSLIRLLQDLGCVDIGKEYAEAPPDGAEALDTSAEDAEVKSRIAEAGSALDFLAGYATKTKGLFNPPREIDRKTADSDEARNEAYGRLKRAVELKNEKARITAETSALKNELSALEPWTDLNIPLPESSTITTKTVAGLMTAKTDPETVLSNAGNIAAVAKTVATGKTHRYVLLTAHRDDYDEALSALTRAGFAPTPAKADEESGFAMGKFKSLAKKLRADEEKLAEIDEEAKNLSEHTEKIEVYYDLLTTDEARIGASSKMAVTAKVGMVGGWIPEAAVPLLKEKLDGRGDAYEFTDPTEEDDVPVLLKNNRFARNFEPVVELYSLPKYGTFDPTFIMSLFYIVIFGMMLADVGYGLLISLGCFLGIGLMKPKKSMRRMLTMFGMCGISCIVMGVLFGGYFGDVPAVLAEKWFRVTPPKLALWFDPLTNFTTFLILSLAIGALHLVCGLCIKFYVLWKIGKKFDAVCDVGSWIVLFLGAASFLLNRTAGLVMVILGVVMLVATQGRHHKNIFMKIFGGIGSLYSIIGYLSDLLSYSRILALGLASMVIASVFNILGTLPGPSVIGVAFFIVIFLVGHLLNMAINMLGTFVHTSRLQYIEFFGKFYEDGGKPFEPLTAKSKYVIFK